MSDSNLMHKRLAQVSAERNCPSAKILMEQLNTVRIQAHLKECDFCRDVLKGILERNDEEWQSFAEDVVTELKAMAFEQDGRPTIGEVRSVREDFVSDTFYESRWHNPPLVLVISEEQDRVLVAQISDQSLFADRGDIFIDNDEVWFAQAWNTWTMPAHGLGPVLERAVSGAAETVLELSKEENSPISDFVEDFRRIERSVGEFYSHATQH